MIQSNVISVVCQQRYSEANRCRGNPSIACFQPPPILLQ